MKETTKKKYISKAKILKEMKLRFNWEPENKIVTRILGHCFTTMAGDKMCLCLDTLGAECRRGRNSFSRSVARIKPEPTVFPSTPSKLRRASLSCTPWALPWTDKCILYLSEHDKS